MLQGLSEVPWQPPSAMLKSLALLPTSDTESAGVGPPSAFVTVKVLCALKPLISTLPNGWAIGLMVSEPGGRPSPVSGAEPITPGPPLTPSEADFMPVDVAVNVTLPVQKPAGASAAPQLLVAL